MKLRNILVLLAFLPLALGAAAQAETFNGLPLHVEQLSDNAIRLWIGDHISSTAVSAIKTDKGIVVIDTTQCPTLDEQFRKIIAREFGRDDFKILINTHEHFDHTAGNSVYTDCKIIAHELCAEGMQARQSDIARVLGWYEENLPQTEAELAKLEKGTDEYGKTREDLITSKMEYKVFKSGIELTLPTKTFSDTKTIPMGNVTFELYAMGGTHTSSDIFVFVPEEGLLFTGDMMADIWLTDTPGCLQSFSLRQDSKRDIPLMLKNWKSLIDRKDEIKDYIPGHWNGDLTADGFAARYAYVETMYNGINQAVQDGKPLEAMFTEFKMDTRFPELAGTPGFTRDLVHHGNILAFWAEATGAESACTALEKMIEKGGIEPAMKHIRKIHSKGSNDYYFLEAEFNALGYRLLNQKHYDQAIAVLRLVTEIYPDSWNSWDSLGEALMTSGKLDKALASYEKSVKLNPESVTGPKAIEDIKAAQAE